MFYSNFHKQKKLKCVLISVLESLLIIWVFSFVKENTVFYYVDAINEDKRKHDGFIRN
jgi:accessory gene regulator protein AgrB